MPHACHRILVCAAMALLLAPALAQYQWKDSRGQMHLSDQPPPKNIPEKDVLKRPAAPVPRPALQPLPTAPGPASAAAARPVSASAPVDPELAQRRAAADQAAKARAQADGQRVAAQRAENCQRARQHLATLDTGTRLVRFNERGERVVLDDAARAQEAAQARNVMAADCR